MGQLDLLVVHFSSNALPNFRFSLRGCGGRIEKRRSGANSLAQLTSTLGSRLPHASLGSSETCTGFQRKRKTPQIGHHTSLWDSAAGSECSCVRSQRRDCAQRHANSSLDSVDGMNFTLAGFRVRIAEQCKRAIGQDLGPLCGTISGFLDGHESWSSLLPRQFFNLSVMFSLSMSSFWMGSASAVAAEECVGELQASSLVPSCELVRTQTPPVKNNLVDSRGTLTWLSLEDTFSRKTLSVHTNEVESRPRIFDPVEITHLADASKVCEETYGFLPCSDSLGGNLSLIFAYGYLLLIAAQLISKGSELLLEVMNPGLIGGLLLPILGALPDALLIFASGSGGTVQEAQEEVLVGVGVLAGSIVMLLTVGWSGSLFAGRCDLSGPEGIAKDRTLTRSLDWTGTGVTTDEQTRVGAWIMMMSTIPFICVQVPLLDGQPAEGPEAALIGCIIALVGLVGYCAYQVSFPWLQQKRIEEARLQYMRSRALQSVTSFSMKSAVKLPFFKEIESGPSQELLKQLFASFDLNQDGHIHQDELKGLLVGLELEEGLIPAKGQVDLWLQEFDVNKDGTLSEHEFLTGIAKWAERISKENRLRRAQQIETFALGANDPNFWAAQSSEARKVLELLEKEASGEASEEKEKEVTDLEASSVKRTAVLYLLGGAALAALFADPLVDSVGGFSSSSGIPPFFVAFAVIPFASNASELFSSILFARMRQKKNISLTLSQLYGAVTTNNTLCLGLFLGIVYLRGLNWDFSSEVTVILLSIFTVGAIGGTRTTFPLWLSVPVLAVYPLCIALVAVLDNYLGWH